MIHVLEGICKPNVQSPGVFKEAVPHPLLNLLNSIQHILILVNLSTLQVLDDGPIRCHCLVQMLQKGDEGLPNRQTSVVDW